MEMIERIEKALRDKYLATRYDGKEHWRDMAIAAINAMRELSEAVAYAGAMETNCQLLEVSNDRAELADHGREIWRAMIDAALSEAE